MVLDITAARASRSYTRREYLGRGVWGLVRPLFRMSPRPLYGWRNLLLRMFGAKIGARVRIDASVRIAIPWNLSIGDDASVGEKAVLYNLGRIDIGARATVSHMAHLCAGTHDYEDPRLPLLRLPISIGSDAWVCAQSFVGPGVSIGTGAVVGAGAVAISDVDDWMVVAGNPARPVKARTMAALP